MSPSELISVSKQYSWEYFRPHQRHLTTLTEQNIDDLVQNCSNSNANALVVTAVLR